MNFSPSNRNVADQIVSAFENSTTEIKYDYCENLDDGRGFTAGRAGFCTGTGDLYEVVKLYTKDNPDNALSEYLPTLKQLAEDEDDDVSDLDGFETDWKEACQDEDFLRCQDAIVDKEYFQPALNYCTENGLQYPLSAACLYDACIQHGDGEDEDSLSALIKRTNNQVGGNPKSSINETEWLYAFLEVRKANLLNPTNAETKDEWSESAGRVDSLKQILESGNINLDGNIAFNAFGDEYNIIA